MLSEYQLSNKHNWKTQNTDLGSRDDRYRVNLAISQLTKVEAMAAKKFITIILQKTLGNYDFFNDNDLLEIDVLNEYTGHYSSYLRDKY